VSDIPVHGGPDIGDEQVHMEGNLQVKGKKDPEQKEAAKQTKGVQDTGI
jgi:hypothetical protein